MKRRRIDPRLAKVHRSYTVEEVTRLFGSHRNTVREWLAAGLKPIDNQRPALILGSELRRFLHERRARRRRETPVGMIFCLPCREPRRPSGDVVDYIPRTATTGDFQGICPECDSILNRRVRLSSLDEVRGGLDVTIRDGDLRIRQRKEPSVNHDSDHPRATHANAQR